jgi:hypothetical protein
MIAKIPGLFPLQIKSGNVNKKKLILADIYGS